MGRYLELARTALAEPEQPAGAEAGPAGQPTAGGQPACAVSDRSPSGAGRIEESQPDRDLNLPDSDEAIDRWAAGLRRLARRCEGHYPVRAAQLQRFAEDAIHVSRVVNLPHEWAEVYEERAAIREYDGELPRQHAERAALAEIVAKMDACEQATKTSRYRT